MTKRNISLTLEAELLDRAERLAQPGENRSQLFERLLQQSLRIAEDAQLDALYDAALATHPVTPEQQPALDARARAAYRSSHKKNGARG